MMGNQQMNVLTELGKLYGDKFVVEFVETGWPILSWRHPDDRVLVFDPNTPESEDTENFTVVVSQENQDDRQAKVIFVSWLGEITEQSGDEEDFMYAFFNTVKSSKPEFLTKPGHPMSDR